MSTTLTLPYPLLPSLAGDAGAAQPVPSEAVLPMQTQSDRALLERVAGGDADAFTALYRRYERPIFAFLLRLAGRRAVAEEWLQETFIRVWLAAGTHDPSRGQVRPWLYKIALNTARSEFVRKPASSPRAVCSPSCPGTPPNRAWRSTSHPGSRSWLLWGSSPPWCSSPGWSE